MPNSSSIWRPRPAPAPRVWRWWRRSPTPGSIMRLTRIRLEGGVAPRTDLSQAEEILSQAQSSLAQQRTLVAQDLNALQQLVGAPVSPELLPTSIDQAGPTIAE